MLRTRADSKSRHGSNDCANSKTDQSTHILTIVKLVETSQIKNLKKKKDCETGYGCKAGQRFLNLKPVQEFGMSHVE